MAQKTKSWAGLAAFLLVAGLLLHKSVWLRRCLCSLARYLKRDFALDALTDLPAPVTGNRVQLLNNGSEALPAILALINGARTSIRWQVMLFAADEVGRTLAAALAAAARRGVRVQLSFNIDQTANGTIADGFSRERKQRQRRAMAAMLADLRAAGAVVRENPAGVTAAPQGASPAAQAAQKAVRRHICIPANHYDHRKLLIFDHERAILGGMNIGKNYLYHHAPDLSADMVQAARQPGPEAWEKWLDAAFKLEGPVVAKLAREFDWKWQVLGGQALQPDDLPAAAVGSSPVQFLRQRPGLAEISTRFFQLVNGAQQEIFVASPFVSFDPAVWALCAASQRGVRVVFVHPRAHQEMPISRRVFRGYEAHLLRAGVALYYNDLRMAHTKLLVVDRRFVLFGSFNLNHRSFRHDLEAAAVVEDEALARQVIEEVFQPYQAISTRFQAAQPHALSLWDWILKPFS